MKPGIPARRCSPAIIDGIFAGQLSNLMNRPATSCDYTPDAEGAGTRRGVALKNRTAAA